MINANSMFYSEEHGLVGKLVSADFIKDTYQLMDIYGNVHTVKTGKVKELERLGTLGGNVVFNHDVLRNNDSNTLFEIVKFEDGFKFHQLDENLERTGNVGSKGKEEDFKVVEDCLEILGNIFEMKKELEEKKAEEMDFDFNIKIYKADIGGKSTYFYAGNNKSDATVDLIKVIYMGHYLLEEEEYEIDSYTYDQFQSLVNTGVIVEASPMELSNFVMGKIDSAHVTLTPVSPASYEEEEEDLVLDFDFEDYPYPYEEEEEEEEKEEGMSKENEERYQQELMEAVGQLVYEVIEALATSANTEDEPAPEKDVEPETETNLKSKKPEPKEDKDSDIYLWD